MTNQTRLLAASLFMAQFSVAATTGNQTMLVLDASGSMWGQIDGSSKISIARQSIEDLANSWPTDQSVGLMAYGHRRKGDCTDIELIVPMGPLSVNTLTETVQSLIPKGKTPLSQAVLNAAEVLKYTEEKATVVLVSDGKETCNMDPCAVGSKLEALGVDFTAHVIGFDVQDTSDQAQLRCLAENTGGIYLNAGNATELSQALQQTTQVKPTEPIAIEAEIIAEETETIGGLLNLKLRLAHKSNIPSSSNVVYLYKAQSGIITEDKRYKSNQQLGHSAVLAHADGSFTANPMRLPNEAGQFILVWQNIQSGQVYAHKSLEITQVTTHINGPSQTYTSTHVPFQVHGPTGLTSYLHLYPAGKEGLAYSSSASVRPNANSYKPTQLAMPLVAGEYIIRWQQHSTSKRNRFQRFAEHKITVLPHNAKFSFSGPLRAGQTVQFEIDAPEGMQGVIHLFPKSGGKSVSYARFRPSPNGGYIGEKLKLPKQAGDYELRWVNFSGQTVMSQIVTVQRPNSG